MSFEPSCFMCHIGSNSGWGVASSCSINQSIKIAVTCYYLTIGPILLPLNHRLPHLFLRLLFLLVLAILAVVI